MVSIVVELTDVIYFVFPFLKRPNAVVPKLHIEHLGIFKKSLIAGPHPQAFWLHCSRAAVSKPVTSLGHVRRRMVLGHTKYIHTDS